MYGELVSVYINIYICVYVYMYECIYAVHIYEYICLHYECIVV